MTELVKRYFAGCLGGGDHTEPPALAVFDLDRAQAAFIVRMAGIVTANDLFRVEQLYPSVLWLSQDPRLTEEEHLSSEEIGWSEVLAADTDQSGDGLAWATDDVMRTEIDRIVIDCESFWFACYPKHGDNHFTTVEIPVSAIAAAFHLPFGPALNIPRPMIDVASPPVPMTLRATVVRTSIEAAEVTVTLHEPRDEAAVWTAVHAAAEAVEGGFTARSTDRAIEHLVVA